MTVKEKRFLIYSLFIILIVTCFTGWFYYINEPLNEDLGGYFDPHTGMRITSLGQVIGATEYVYCHWSGRIPGYFLVFFSKLLPRSVQAVVVAVIFSANVFLAIRIVFRDTLKSLSSPVIFITLYSILYWFRPYTCVNYRWEFVAIYSFTVTMVLLYYNLAGARFDLSECTIGEANTCKRLIWICFVQLVGIIAGMSHEILSFGLIALIGTEWIVDMIRHEAKPISIFRHWGLALGYMIGCLAPGNMQRLNADVTVAAYSAAATTTEQVNSNVVSGNSSGFATAMAGYVDRLAATFGMHELAIIGEARQEGPRQQYVILMIVLVLALLSIAFMLWTGQVKAVCTILLTDIGFMVSYLSSILMWTFVYWQPVYVIWLPVLFVYIVLLEFVIRLPNIMAQSTISKIFNKAFNIARIVVPVIAIIAFIFIYSDEISSFAHTSLARRERIAYAQENGLTEISVPMYDENLTRKRYSISTLNRQGEYDDGYYTKYYGVHLIIEDQLEE